MIYFYITVTLVFPTLTMIFAAFNKGIKDILISIVAFSLMFLIYYFFDWRWSVPNPDPTVFSRSYAYQFGNFLSWWAIQTFSYSLPAVAMAWWINFFFIHSKAFVLIIVASIWLAIGAAELSGFRNTEGFLVRHLTLSTAFFIALSLIWARFGRRSVD